LARLIDIGLERLSSMLLDMATLSEKSVTTSIEAYALGRNVTQEILAWSDELRFIQDEASELAIDIIARYQPVASDLRFIAAAMEISYGFSRFGRYAYDIAEVLEVFGDLSSCDHSAVELTAKTTKEMIRMSIDAFTNRDVELAKNIPNLDDFVDEKYRSNLEQLVNDKTADVKCAMASTLIMRYLERISDHSAYIGDAVIYIVTGKRVERK